MGPSSCGREVSVPRTSPSRGLSQSRRRPLARSHSLAHTRYLMHWFLCVAVPFQAQDHALGQRQSGPILVLWSSREGPASTQTAGRTEVWDVLCRAARDRCVPGLCLASLFLLGGNPSPSLSDCLADLLTPPLHSAFSRAEGRPGTRAWPALPPGSAATPAGAEGRPRGRPSPQSQPCHAAGSQDPGKLRSVCSVICSGHGHMQPALEGGPGRTELSRGWVGAGHQDHVSGARRCRAGVPRKWGGRG